jgi:peptide methionine sulfoxide reductase MsrA
MYISNSLNADPAVNNRRSSVGAPNVHNEVVLVVFDPGVIDFEALPGVFWEAHDPAQGMRQGNDSGIQYRSGIYYL